MTADQAGEKIHVSYAVSLLKGSSQNLPEGARFVMAPWSSSPGVYDCGGGERRLVGLASNEVVVSLAPSPNSWGTPRVLFVSEWRSFLPAPSDRPFLSAAGTPFPLRFDQCGRFGAAPQPLSLLLRDGPTIRGSDREPARVEQHYRGPATPARSSLRFHWGATISNASVHLLFVNTRRRFYKSFSLLRVFMWGDSLRMFTATTLTARDRCLGRFAVQF